MLYHVTTCFNMASIDEHGLLVSKSQGKAKRVWLVSYERLLWAEQHVMMRHGALSTDIVFIPVNTSGLRIRSSGREGVYWTAEDVPTDHLRGWHRLAMPQLAVPMVPDCMADTVE